MSVSSEPSPRNTVASTLPVSAVIVTAEPTDAIPEVTLFVISTSVSVVSPETVKLLDTPKLFDTFKLLVTVVNPSVVIPETNKSPTIVVTPKVVIPETSRDVTLATPPITLVDTPAVLANATFKLSTDVKIGLSAP